MSTTRALATFKLKSRHHQVSHAPVSLSFKLLMMLTLGQLVTTASAISLNAILTTDSQEYGVEINTWREADPQATVDGMIKACGPFHDHETVVAIPYATPGSNHSISMFTTSFDHNVFVNLWRKNLTAVDVMLEGCLKLVASYMINATNAWHLAEKEEADAKAAKYEKSANDSNAMLLIAGATCAGVLVLTIAAGASLTSCYQNHRLHNQPTQMRDLEQGRRRRRQRNNPAAVPALQVEGVSVDDRHDAFRDPISLDLMVDPVVCADGHSYSRHTVTEWLRTHDTSPVTGLRLEHKNLIPNHELKKAIEEYQALKEPEAAVEPVARQRLA